MAGRGLQHLKFMQRARQREEAIRKAEEEEEVKEKAPKDDSHWTLPTPKSQSRCVVIMEADPKPGALLGRMSFQNFNPAVDKLNEEAEALYARKTVILREKAGGAHERPLEKTARIYEVAQNGDVRKTEADNLNEKSPQKRPKLEPDEGSTEGMGRSEMFGQSEKIFKPWKGWRDGGDYRMLRPPKRSHTIPDGQEGFQSLQ